MPVVSVFFGIVIRMYHQDREPMHLHAEHHGEQGVFDAQGRLLAGRIGSKAARTLFA